MTGLAAAPDPHQAATFATPGHVGGRQRLLDLDPDLGRLLEGERRAAALSELWVGVHRRTRGPWPITPMAPDALEHHLGVLVIDGVIASDILLEDVVSTELLGAGDIVRPWPPDRSERLLGDKTQWIVLAECRVAILDRQAAATLSRFPEVYAAWVLHGDPPRGAEANRENLLSRRRLFVEQRSERAPDRPQALNSDDIELQVRRLRREADALEAQLAQRRESLVGRRRTDLDAVIECVFGSSR